MAELSRASLKGKLGISAITGLFGGVVSYVIQKVLGVWGILDPLAVSLGKWLKVSVTPDQLGWTLALIFVLAVYGFILWRVWKPRHIYRNIHHIDQMERITIGDIADAEIIKGDAVIPSQIVFEGLTREGPWYFLHIRGAGASISDGLVKVVCIENDTNSSHLPMALRTQGQHTGERYGSFNLRVGEPKKIPFLKVKNLYDTMPETVDVAYEADGHFCHISDQNERIFHLLACGGGASTETQVRLSFDEHGKARADMLPMGVGKTDEQP